MGMCHDTAAATIQDKTVALDTVATRKRLRSAIRDKSVPGPFAPKEFTSETKSKRRREQELRTHENAEFDHYVRNLLDYAAGMQVKSRASILQRMLSHTSEMPSTDCPGRALITGKASFEYATACADDFCPETAAQARRAVKRLPAGLVNCKDGEHMSGCIFNGHDIAVEEAAHRLAADTNLKKLEAGLSRAQKDFDVAEANDNRAAESVTRATARVRKASRASRQAAASHRRDPHSPNKSRRRTETVEALQQARQQLDTSECWRREAQRTKAARKGALTKCKNGLDQTKAVRERRLRVAAERNRP